MPVLKNIGSLATCPQSGGQAEIGVIESAALAWEDGVVRWRGPQKELPAEFDGWDVYDAHGGLVVPGLIDCHTHLAFGGWRAEEFEARLRGQSYHEIARQGGGIASTMRATRNASEERLLAKCVNFAREMVRLGVTAVECKSGYGLNVECEKKILRVYGRLAGCELLRVVPTFLGAHTVPPELRRDRRLYLDLLVEEMIPAVSEERLAVFCDVFLEESAFSRDEARRILEAGRKAGLGAKIHADQLSDGGGAALAAELGAVSADHLECVSEAGVAALADSAVVAVSLPLATLYLDQRPMPARRLIEAGVPVAVATDFNPGTAPSYHLPLAMTLACVLQKMTPAEVLKGATAYAARAIRFDEAIGSLEPGKAADFAIIDAPDVNHWLYHFRPTACVATFIGGVEAAAAE